MIFLDTAIPGVFVLETEPMVDERGLFARVYCAEEFARRELCTTYAQCSVSCNTSAGSLRGMHYQAAPHGEVKLVRCTAGVIFDVVLDLREDSPAFLRWEAVVLSAENRRQLYIPEGVAHGFQTMADETEVFYQISTPFRPEAARGVRWDDPAFGISWPDAPSVISERDRSFPDFRP